MSVERTGNIVRASLLAWEVSANQEEPWRRFLQELSGSHHEEYIASRRRLSIFAESTWFAPKSSGGGVAVVFLEAEDPEWALRELVAELAASETPFDLWYGKEMHKLFGCAFTQLTRIANGELLFLWREASGEGEHEPSADL
jgi:hypothetical protein